ncbi:MAG: metal ABC transporter permease [Elusimicrobia bacterium]|nr:metal ABC transporter permease [Elusimicrobiota bacterium]
MEIISYGFAQRALISGALIAAVSAALGVFLVLRRMSLIGDGLSHASFAGIALGFLLGLNPLYVALPVSVLASLAIMKIAARSKVYGDAAIGMVSALGVAVAVIISALSGGFNLDLFGYLFGNVLTVTKGEVFLCLIFSAAAILFVRVFYHELVLMAFDWDYARVCGINARGLNTAFTAVTACVVVLSIKIAGVMLVSALLIIPAAAAMEFARGFKRVIFLACALSVTSVVLGIYISFWLDLPSGAVIVLINFIFFVAGYFCRRLKCRF